MNFNSRFKSFAYALNGLKIMLGKEPNSRIHLIAGVFVILAGIIFNINAIEWCIVLICIGIVISTELLNTSIEQISNFVSPEYNMKIKSIKDLGAAAVLITAITSLIIFLIIFIPKIIDLL